MTRTGTERTTYEDARDCDPRSAWIVALDLGQSLDPSAIAVLQVTSRQTAHVLYRYAHPNVPPELVAPTLDWYEPDRRIRWPRYPARIDVAYLSRLPLRMPYPDQIDRVAALLAQPPLANRADLVVDATGCGRPVIDMFVRAGLRPVSVTITGGNEQRAIP